MKKPRQFLLATLLVGVVIVVFSSYYFHHIDTSYQLGNIVAEIRSNYAREEDVSNRNFSLQQQCDSEVQEDGSEKNSYKWLALHRKLLDHILVDRVHKVLYCYIPKVACTNWKRIFLIMTRKTNYTRPEDIPSNYVHRGRLFVQLSSLQPPDIYQRLQTYRKFTFVRHPIERLVSAFRNKFERNFTSSAYFKNRYGILILKKYRNGTISTSGEGVLFPEFAQYIIDTFKDDPRKLNEHWAPFYQLCLPCDVRYDLIGKYEYLESDASYILQQIAAPAGVNFPAALPSQTSKFVDSYMSTLSKNQTEELLQIFEPDFRLFGYQIKNFER